MQMYYIHIYVGYAVTVPSVVSDLGLQYLRQTGKLSHVSTLQLVGGAWRL